MTFSKKVREAKKLIKWAINAYPDIALGCSFGKDSVVLLHLIRKIKKDIPVFSVLANTEFPQTIKFKDRMVKKWRLNYKEYTFEQSENAGEHCCKEIKVEKFKEAVKDLSAWFSAIRKTEGITRAQFKLVEEANGLTKVNPLLNFNELDIWRYTALNRLFVNPLYKKGYRSLGCKFCSSKETNEREAERTGRWRGTSACGGECGIHTQPLK